MKLIFNESFNEKKKVYESRKQCMRPTKKDENVLQTKKSQNTDA